MMKYKYIFIAKYSACLISGHRRRTCLMEPTYADLSDPWNSNETNENNELNAPDKCMGC